MSIDARANQTFIANTDLSTYQYLVVVNSTGPRVGRAGTAGGAVLGVLQNKPQSGEHATVTCLGFTKCFAGGTITAGGQVSTTASATATAVASGDYILGTALSGVASGGYFDLMITHSGFKG